MPKLSGSLGRSRRSIRIATVASSIAALTSSGVFGLTSSCRPNVREPNIFWKTPSGMIAKLSCELPKTEPFFSLTPTTRKCSVADLDRLVERIGRAEQLVGDVPPEDAPPGDCASTSAGLMSRPRSASKVEK